MLLGTELSMASQGWHAGGMILSALKPPVPPAAPWPFQIERIEALGEPAVDRAEKTRQQYNDRKKGRTKAYGPRSKTTLRLLAGIGTVSLREKA